MPVNRFDQKLREEKYASRIGSCAPVYLTATIEYLCLEILEGAQIEDANAKKRRITPRHIAVSIGQDEELNKLLKDVVFPYGGIVPHVNKELLQNNSKRILVPKS